MPDFDPNFFNKSDLASQRNRALADLYEPGSTFKIVAVSGCMNDGLIAPQSIIDCSVSSIVRVRKLRLPGDHNPLGKITVSEVVQKSSNRGAAQLGIMLGAGRLYEYCRAFGFGENKFRDWGEKRNTSSSQKLGWFNNNEVANGACCKHYSYAGLTLRWQLLRMEEF